MSIDYSDIEILSTLAESDTSVVSTDYSSAAGTYLDLVSSNLIYQLSSEHIRKAIGGFFFVRDETDDYNKLVFSANLLTVDEEDDIRGLNMGYVSPLSNKISKLEVNPSRIFTIDENVALPNVKIPFRAYADSENVLGDVYWREYITGGEYGGTNFNSLYDVDNIYYDIAISFKTPVDYKILRACEYLDYDISEDASIFEIKSNYKDYNQYVQNYQDWCKDLESELLIPNYNIILDKFVLLSEKVDASESTLSIISRDYRLGQTDAYDNVMEYNIVPGLDMLSAERDRYYGSFFVNHQHRNELKQNVIRSQQNLIFAHEYFHSYWAPSSDFTDDFMVPTGDYSALSEIIDAAGLKIDQHASTFYNAEIKFTRHKLSNDETDSPVAPQLNNLTSHSGMLGEGGAPATGGVLYQPKLRSGGSFLTYDASGPTPAGAVFPQTLSAKFLEILKDIDENTITNVPIRTQSFGYANNFMSVITENGLPSQVQTAADLPIDTIGIKSINYIQLLTYIYNNYDIAINDNYIFLGPQQPEYASTVAKDTLYKNKISQNVLHSLDRAVELLEDYFLGVTADIEAETARDVQEIIFENVLSPAKKYYEVMAYKIEKFGGTTTGDSSTQNVIQKFWIYNDENAPDTISITDSQVKYGETYTYRISAYALVLAHKYKYADYRLTKQIGSGQKLDPDDVTEEPKFCLQFYNPATNERATQIFTTTTPEDEVIATFLEYAESAFAGESDFAVDQIDISTYPQLADFHLYLEPCLEIIEIPFAEKTINILDSPPNAINVTPFHFIDNSDRIGFKIGQDGFIKRPYPELITDADLATKTQYLRSRERASYQNIIEPSESPARYIEMYRTDKRPNAFTDFRNALVSTIDLRIENSEYNYLDYITADKIVPNKKYYYVFRLLNENRMPGPLSQIIEAQLTNDGGYVYSTFDKVDSSEFNPNKVQTKTKNAKKIFQLEPHIHQMVLDTTNADFTNVASEEVDNIKVGVAERSIWDSKRFKIRLTSTKTGRKLDLNTGFNVRIKDLTTVTEDEVPEVDDDTVPTDPITDDGGTVDEDTTDEETYEKPVDDEDTTDTPDKPDVPEEEDEPKPGEHPGGPPPPYTGGGEDPSDYGLQVPTWMLYSSQVHFIVYGGIDSDGHSQPNVFRKIRILMDEMGYGSIPASDAREARLRMLFNGLGRWLWQNRETPRDRIDNRMFIEHLAFLLAVHAPGEDWVSAFYAREDVTIHPSILNYASSTILGAAAGGSSETGLATAEAIIEYLQQGIDDASADT